MLPAVKAFELNICLILIWNNYTYRISKVGLEFVFGKLF